MALFVPTVWALGGPPSISAAQLNRIEAGIANTLTLDTAQTITAAHTFDPGLPGPPFIVGTNAQDVLVPNLNSALLGGYAATAFPRKAETASITEIWAFAAQPTFQAGIKVPGAAIARFGDSGEFQIQHTGANSYAYNHAGAFKIQELVDGGEVTVQAKDSGSTTRLVASFAADTSTLYAAGAAVLEATSAAINFSTGVAVTIDGNEVWHAGNDGPTSGLDADTFATHALTEFPLKAATATITELWAFSGGIKVPDSQTLRLGDAGDCTAGHDGLNTAIQNATGEMRIQALVTSGAVVLGARDSGATYRETARFRSASTVLTFADATRTLTLAADGDIDLHSSSLLNFGSAVGAKLNLYGTAYGAGIQTETLFSRVALTGCFTWYKGGVFSSTRKAPGAGGALLMDLESDGDLTVLGALSLIGNTFNISGSGGTYELNAEASSTFIIRNGSAGGGLLFQQTDIVPSAVDVISHDGDMFRVGNDLSSYDWLKTGVTTQGLFSHFSFYGQDKELAAVSGAQTIDWRLSNLWKASLTGATTFTFTAPAGPTTLTLLLDPGGNTPTFPGSVTWASGAPPTASGYRVIFMAYDGTTYYANLL